MTTIAAPLRGCSRNPPEVIRWDEDRTKFHEQLVLMPTASSPTASSTSSRPWIGPSAL